MALFTPDKIISELVPFIQKIMPNEEDEVLLGIAEEMPHFRNYLDDKQITNTFPLFQFLFGCEETVVRGSAIEAMRKLVPALNDDQVQKDIIPMIINLSNLEAFQCKVSACFLIRMCYSKAGSNKDKLRALYFKLCDDETPLIKKTAAKEFGPLCLVVEKEIVSGEMVGYYKKFMNDADTVKVTILPSLVQMVKLFQNTDLQRLNIQFIVAASEDKSWRVRNELARIFPQLLENLGSQIVELVPTLANLIKDSETEVKISALKSLQQIIFKISVDKITVCVIPSLKSLNNESSTEVKAIIGECFGPIAHLVGYTTFNDSLGTMMDLLLKDENAEVRLGITKSMYEIFISSGTLINSINAVMGNMQKDNQYRIRECLYDTLARLGANYGLEVFKASIEGLFFNYLSDTVSSVREVGINSLPILIEKFGTTWITTSLIPKLQGILNTPKSSYLNRMCLIHSLIVVTKYLETKQNAEHIYPSLVKGLKDKIPNVRFYTIKIIQSILAYFDGSTKEKIKIAVKELTSDDDLDVRFYATQYLENFS